MTSDGGKFRLQNTRVFLTYKGHIDKTELMRHITVCSKMEPTWFRAAHETGDENHPYEHTHALVKWNRMFQTTKQRIFDLNTVHPNIKPITSERHWKNATQYLAKEDEENADLIEERGFAEQIWSHETVEDALKTEVQRASDVMGIIALYKCKPKEGTKVDPPKEWRTWQADTIKILEGPIHPREIIWIWDESGASGKSVLTRYLMDHMNAIGLTTAPGQRDTAQILTKCQPLDKKIIVFDMARQTQDKNFYEPMEHIKNGNMTSTKYEGGILTWVPGHLIVMANFPPDMGKWTWDRYAVHKPTREGLRRLRWHNHSWVESLTLVKDSTPEEEEDNGEF